ncbi:MAG: twin-arginine translocase TatA/TatE family subunit [Coriobacteriia bacterium]|nr:twin-arginine translocase TatA/TatE family subunit [Coriobacteriia bacterium]
MFGIGGTELIIVAVVALLLFGPDKLPQIARTVGRFMRDFKRYQDIMESTIRAEMYASEDKRPDPFAKGKDFREKVQAEQAEQAEAAAELAQESSESPEPSESSEGEGERSVSDET